MLLGLCVNACVCARGVNVPVEENACEQAAMSTKAEERQLRGAGTEAEQVVCLSRA